MPPPRSPRRGRRSPASRSGRDRQSDGFGAFLDDFLALFRLPSSDKPRTSAPPPPGSARRAPRASPLDALADWFGALSFGPGRPRPDAEARAGAKTSVRRPGRDGSRLPRAWWQEWWLIAGVGLTVPCVLVGIAIAAIWQQLPDPRGLLALKSGAVRLLYDDGAPMENAGVRPGPFLQPDKVPDLVRQGFVATEDRRFFEHKGVDGIGIVRALASNLTGGRKEGGSTITEQLVHIYFLKDIPSNKKTVFDKIKEAVMAWKVEQRFTKLEILQAYMTVIPYADGKWGVEDAAQYYFGKDVKDVTPSEAAMIVGAVQGTSEYNPHLHPDAAWRRAQTVLGKMHDAPELGGLAPLTDAQYQAALASPPKLAEPQAPFWRWTASRVMSSLNLATQAQARQTDFVVTTSLNRDAENAAVAAVQKNLAGRAPMQAVLVALNGDGEVKAYAPAVTFNGGPGYAEEPHQIGSVMKLFIYSAAMGAGATPDDQCDDTPGAFGPGHWSPHDDDTPMGRVSLKTAFAVSSNIVATRLANEVGYDRVATLSERLRLPPLKPRSIAAWPLAEEASPLDVARALLPYANGGMVTPVRFAHSITNGRGHEVYTAPTAIPTLSHRVLHAMHEVARAVVTEPGATGHAAGVAGLWIAGKTGTTTSYRNAWFAGYGNGFVVVVWVGRPDQRPMNRVFGGTIPAAIFHDFMATQRLGWGRSPPPDAEELKPGPYQTLDQAISLLPAPIGPGLYHGPGEPPPGQGCAAT